MRTGKKSESDFALTLPSISEWWVNLNKLIELKIPPFYNERYALDHLLGSVQSW